MNAARLTLGVTGLAALGWGLWLVLSGDDLVSIALWLAGGVLAHDAVLAPLTLAVVVVGTRLLPMPARAPAALGLVIWGSVTIAVSPLLIGVGGKADNPTLLNGSYLTWWLGLSAATLALVVAATWRRSRPRA